METMTSCQGLMGCCPQLGCCAGEGGGECFWVLPWVNIRRSEPSSPLPVDPPRNTPTQCQRDGPGLSAPQFSTGEEMG